MTEKKDIQTREDLEMLLSRFYEKVFKDDLIGYFFTDVMHVQLDKHIPTITDFWETVLLKGDSYKKNAVIPHLRINELAPIEARQFERWLKLFHETIDEHFRGEVAETAKQRSTSIATIMRIKIANSKQQIQSNDNTGSTGTG